MATRYEKVISHIDSKREGDRRICKNLSCACKGCCGVVGGKKITQQELDMYLSGEMQRIVKGDKDKP